MRNILAPLLVVAAAPLTAQTTPPAVAPAPAAPAAPAPELTARIAALMPVLQGGGDYDASFSAPFRAQVPKPAFDAVTAQLAASAGRPLAIAAVHATAPYAGTIDVTYERATVTMRIAVDPAPPHQITGLLVTGVSVAEASLPAVDAALAQLPGTTGLLLARLDPAGPVPLAARNADRAFAIGSEFKLLILATLVRDVAAGTRRWDDLVTLDGTQRPAGGWSQAAKGTQVSIRELAGKMISVSDNSATDILLETVGRTRVEAMMATVGVAAPGRNRPFLSTAELFKLKAVPTLADRYAAAGEAGRRALLAKEVAATPLSAVPPTLFADGKPVRIEQLEWYLSPADVARTLDWIRRHSESGPAADVRAILAINPALTPAGQAAWRYAGYKGGSEPGVLTMSWLLQAKDGRWYVLSGGWNDPANGLDQTRFIALMQRGAELAAATP